MGPEDIASITRLGADLIDQDALRKATAEAIKRMPDAVLAAMVRGADTNTILSLTWKATEAPKRESWPHTEEVVGRGTSKIPPDPDVADRDLKPPDPVKARIEEGRAAPKAPRHGGRKRTGTAVATHGGKWEAMITFEDGSRHRMGPTFEDKEGARTHAIELAKSPPDPPPPPPDGLTTSERGELGRNKVLTLIENCDHAEGISKREIEEQTGLSGPAVSNHLQRLKRLELARLEGDRVTARWFPCE